MRADRCPSPAIALALALAIGVASAAALAAERPDPPARFALDAELRPLAVSACGRYAIEASARYAPEAKSADGRYTLKSVNAPAGGCDPLPDPVFANGFETP